MSGIGEFLKEAFEWLYRFWPARIILDWEQGIRLRAGRATEPTLTSKNGLLGTGLHLFWPVIGDVISTETNIEVIETDLQTVTTADGKAISFSLGVKYRIRDLRLLWMKIHDADDTIVEEVRSAAGRAAVNSELNPSSAAEFGDMVEKQVKEQTWGWGLEILDVRVINFTTARPVRLLTG